MKTAETPRAQSNLQNGSYDWLVSGGRPRAQLKSRISRTDWSARGGAVPGIHRCSAFLRLHQSISSSPVRFEYERGTHSLNNSNCGENRFISSSRVVPNGGPVSSGIR